MTGKEDGKEKATESRRLWEGEERVRDTSLIPEA